ncbi:MAG TPA: hypothetical protein GX010_03230 [Erysipelotrichaceae bacterium]|nr:hypothetical protein [Erysipelotrichaceae bacterium]
MKNAKYLVLLPFLLLTSCGAEQISEEQAAPIVERIKNEEIGINTHSFDYNLEYRYFEGKGDDRLSVSASCRYKRDFEKGNMYYYQKGYLSTTKSSDDWCKIFVADDEQHGKVTYVEYDVGGEEGTYAAYGEGASIPSAVQLISAIGIAYASNMYRAAKDIESLVSDCDNVRYYSNDEEHLKVVMKYEKDKTSEENEETKKIENVIEFNNCLLTLYSSIQTTTFDNINSLIITISYSNVSINLPSNWKNALE